MRSLDVLGFAWRALWGYRLRSLLMLIAMVIGVTAVVTLTALGEGARRFVIGEFTALGTHLLIVLPGRAETTGGHPPLLGETPRDLTVDDALALLRDRNVRRIAPVMVGAAPASWRGREREVTVLGTTAEFVRVRRLELAQGRNVPDADPRTARPVCLLGTTVRDELFGPERAIGRWLRIGDRRFRVVGVLAPEGRSIGVDVDDVVLIPVGSAEALFNRFSLFRILIEARTREGVGSVQENARRIIRARHDGEDDVTVITQDAVVATFDKILRALTYTVGAIAAVSLAVAGILIMNVMLVAVAQRTAEIGLLKALGAAPRSIHRLFLVESALLSASGALIGLALGTALSAFLGVLFPQIPFQPPLWALFAAFGVALCAGVAFGLVPARRAASLSAVDALARR